ncbi:MAG: hypothetical protein RL385_1629 [Pseudomonadota bacterium]
MLSHERRVYQTFLRPLGAPAALIIAVLLYACVEPQSLGSASVPCEPGACPGDRVIAPDASVPTVSNASLVAAASVLHGLYRGTVLSAQPPSPVLFLNLRPSDDTPLVGELSFTCATPGQCTGFSLEGLSGTYNITGTGAGGFARGYLLLGTTAGEIVLDIQGVAPIDLYGDAFFITLGNTSQPWLSIRADRLSDVPSAPPDGGAP